MGPLRPVAPPPPLRAVAEVDFRAVDLRAAPFREPALLRAVFFVPPRAVLRPAALRAPSRALPFRAPFVLREPVLRALDLRDPARLRDPPRDRAPASERSSVVVRAATSSAPRLLSSLTPRGITPPSRAVLAASGAKQNVCLIYHCARTNARV